MAQLETGLKIIESILSRRNDTEAHNALDVLIHSLLSAERDGTEDMLKEEILSKLSAYFFVMREVNSIERGDTHNRAAGRIDAVLIHKKQNKFVVGVEFKGQEKKKGKDLHHWLAQMERYSNYRWAGFDDLGKIPILSCPQISFNYLLAVRSIFTHGLNHDHNNINSLIAKGNRCGEIRIQQKTFANPSYTPYKKMFFSFKNKKIWTEYGYGNDYVNMDAYNKIYQELNRD